MTAPKRTCVAFLNSHPIQYFAPFYRHLNRSPDIEAVPIYLSDFSLRGAIDEGFGQSVKWDVDLLKGTDPLFVEGASTRQIASARAMIAPGIVKVIRRGKFDALVIHGHSVGANYLALAAAKSFGIPTFTRGDTNGDLPRGGLKAKLRRVWLQGLYARLDGMLAIGSANRDFYRAMGVPERKIDFVPFTVDNERLSAASALTGAERLAYRQRLGVSADGPVALFASKFEPRKRAGDLIRAASRLAEQDVQIELVVAGSGEQDAALRALAAAHPKLRAVFPGFVNQSALPKLLGACDLFVLPSEREPWGLIVNEAMCAGLPVVATREVGAARDLVRDGKNGRVIAAGDIDALAEALREIVTDGSLRKRMSAASRAIIATWSYAESEAGLRAALRRTGVLR